MDLKYSFIIPIYNIENYIRKCVDSILNQEYKNFEIILINDGSTDESLNICNNYAQIDKRVKVINQSNTGVNVARIKGIEAASGKYICCVDGDDFIEKDYLSIIENYTLEDNIDIICFNYYVNTLKKETKKESSKFCGTYTKQEIDKILECILYDKNKKFFNFGILPALWCKVIKKEILLSSIADNCNINFGEDVIANIQCYLKAQKVIFIKNNLYHYNKNIQSLTKSYQANRMKNIYELCKYIENINTSIICNFKEQLVAYKAFLIQQVVFNQAKMHSKLHVQKEGIIEWIKLNDIKNIVNKIIKYKNISLFNKIFFLMLRNGYISILLFASKIVLNARYFFIK